MEKEFQGPAWNPIIVLFIILAACATSLWAYSNAKNVPNRATIVKNLPSLAIEAVKPICSGAEIKDMRIVRKDTLQIPTKTQQLADMYGVMHDAVPVSFSGVVSFTVNGEQITRPIKFFDLLYYGDTGRLEGQFGAAKSLD